MKATRIFANNDPNTYSEKEYNGINLDSLVTKMASIDEERSASALPAELLASLTEEVAEREASTTTRTRKVAELHPSMKDWTIEDGKPVKKAEGDDEEGDKEEEVEEKEDVKEATASRRQLHFDSPDQISAAAIRTAEANGDNSLVTAIMEVRDQVRNKLSEKFDADAAELADTTSKVANRRNWRMKVVANTQEARKALASTEEIFKAPNALNAAEKNVFIKKATAAGFDADFIQAFLGERFAQTEEAPLFTEIKDVMASELSENVKAAALKGLIREAKLDNENISRLKRYWKEELGYGDEAWVDDLFTSKYDN